MASPTSREVTEWIGGMTRLPNAVDVFVWLDREGVVLGSALFREGQAAAEIGAFFEATTQAPKARAPHVPARVRLASRELADALRAAVGTAVEVLCAPTRELVPIFADLASRVESAPPTYLTVGIDARAVARLFRAAARLQRANPWGVNGGNDVSLTVRIEALDVERAPLLIVGEPGESVALLLGNDPEQPEKPPHFVLELEARERIDPALLEEIAAHRWEVAGTRAYPSAVVVVEGGAARPPTARELAALEAVAHALSELIERKANLRGPGAHALDVETALGEVRVEMTTTVLSKAGGLRPPHG